MQILTAKHSGFCEGVERAYRIALEQSKLGRQIFMLGKLVHNTQVVEKFEKAGVKTVSSIAEIPNGSTVIFSAHGVTPQTYDQAKAKQLVVIDTSCGWVKKAQRVAKQFHEAGRQVIIIGDKGHTEVKGLIGWAGGAAPVIEDIKDIEGLGDMGIKGIGVLAQTTQSEKRFNKIVAELKKKFTDVKAINTICDATAKRQSAAIELAQKVDLMLIIGDQLSANTKRLTELCAQTGTETHQIQTVNEMDSRWRDRKIERIGITAGASTPDWVIQAVVDTLNV
ncbi:MAG: 4-hydroxy-3-methylbut-2-enyl diphosphate reductase [bacterium]